MAFSYVKYTANGGTTQFTITFGYLAREHVEVRFNGVLKTLGTHYTFLNPTTIQTTAGNTPANGVVVELRRNTPKTIPFIDFTDGATLGETDLDQNALQALYLAQESLDASADALALIQALAATGAHATSHQNNGSDEILVTGLSGLLADAQTPLAHAASHQAGGGDGIKLDDLVAPDDNTDLDASTTKHGLMKKYPNNTTDFLRADGTFAVPPAGGSGFNYTFNGDMEIWGSGTSAAPTGWTLVGASATVAKDATNFKISTASAALTRVGTDCRLSQAVQSIFHGINWWKGKTVTFGCWVRATVASRARIGIADGVGETFSSYHTGGSAWEFLTVTRTIDSGATSLGLNVWVDTGNTTAQFDGAILVVGASVTEFVPSGWRGRKCVISMGSNAGQTQGTTQFVGVQGGNAAESAVWTPAPFKGVARRLCMQTDTNVGGAGQTAVATFRAGLADTALVATINSGASAAQDTTNEILVTLQNVIAVKVVLSATTGTLIPHCAFEFEEVP